MSKSVEFEVLLKTGKFREAAQESKRAIEDVGSAVSGSSSAMSDGFSSLGEQIEFQKGIIRTLKDEIKQLEAALKNATPGREWANVVTELNDVKRELAGEEKGLIELQGQLEETEQKHVSLRAQIKATRDEMETMALAGKDNTAEYEALKQRLGELTDIYGDIRAQGKELANDERNLQGIISGLTGLSGAFSAATGAVALFGGENENLQKIMLKVQSLMAITVGLQQVEQALNKDSAFRLVTINGLKEWWAKVVKEATAAEIAENVAMEAGAASAVAEAAAMSADTTATQANAAAKAEAAAATASGAAAHTAGAAAAAANATATTASGAAAIGASGAFKILGTAIKSIPVIGWILAAVAALGSLIGLIVKERRHEKENNALLKERRDIIKEVNEVRRSAVESVAEEESKLRLQIKLLKASKEGTESYNRSVKAVAQSLGVNEEWLMRNREKVDEIADAWINVKRSEAMSEAYAKQYAEERINGEKKLLSLRQAASTNDMESNKQNLMQAGFTDRQAQVIADNVHRRFSNNPAKIREGVEWLNDYERKLIADNQKALDAISGQQEAAINSQIAVWKQYDELTKGKGKEADASGAMRDASSLLPGYEANLKKLQEERDRQLEAVKMKLGATVEINGEAVTIDSDAVEQEMKRVTADYQSKADALAEEYGVKLPLRVTEEVELTGFESSLAKLEADREARLREIAGRLNTVVTIGGAEVTIDADAVEQEMEVVMKQFDEELKELESKYGIEVPVKVDDEEAKAKYQQLVEEYADYRVKLAAINAKYDGQLSDAGADESLKGLIEQSRQRELSELTASAVLAGEAFGGLGESVEVVGENMRRLLEHRLKALVKYVNENRGRIDLATPDKAMELGVGVDELKTLLSSDDALAKLQARLDEIGSSNPFKTLTESLKKYRELQRACREDGGPVDEVQLAKAKDALMESVYQVGDAIRTGLEDLSSSLKEIGEYLGDDRLVKAGDMLDDVLGNLQAAEEGVQAWGGWWGAIIGGVTDLIPKLIKWLKPFDSLDAKIGKTYEDIDKLHSRMDDPSFYDWWEHFDDGQTRDRIEGMADVIVAMRESWEEAGEAFVESFEELSALDDVSSESYLNGIRNLMASARVGEHVGGELYMSFNKYCDEAIGLIGALANEYEEEMSKAGDKTSGKHYERAQELASRIEELTKEYAERTAEFIEEVFGGSATDIASQLGDAMMDAFANGESAARAWGDAVNDIIGGMARNLIRQKIFEAPIAQMMEEYEQEYSSINFRGENGGLLWWINRMPDIYDRMMSIGEDAETAMSELPDWIREFLTGGEAGTLSGSIQGITSEQAGMLAGQMNAMRMAQSAQTELLTSQLEALNDIEHNTRYVRDIYEYLRRNDVGANNNLNRAYGQN